MFLAKLDTVTASCVSLLPVTMDHFLIDFDDESLYIVFFFKKGERVYLGRVAILRC